VLERTAITRPTLSRSDASFNGEAQKTRVGEFFLCGLLFTFS
jgi:hypothetical protein